MRYLLLLAGALAINACTLPMLRPAATATYTNPVAGRGLPGPDGDPRARRLLLRLRDAVRTRRQDGQYPGRATSRPVALAGDRRCAAGQAFVGGRRRRISGAPHVLRDGQRYLMYYSAKPDAALKDDKRGLCLAIAVRVFASGDRSSTSDGRSSAGKASSTSTRWCSTTRRPASACDHSGSGFQPIRVQELGRDNVSFAPGSKPVDLVWPNKVKNQFPVLVEGAWVIHRDGWYYMFYSGDNCCGPKANYAVMVARSKSATGPFQTLEQANGTPHSVILQKAGLLGRAGAQFDRHRRQRGCDWIVYHAVDAGPPSAERRRDDANTRRVMLIDRIGWRNGWPYVVGPTAQPLPGPAIRS